MHKYFIAAFLIIFFAGSILLYGDIGGKSGRTQKSSSAGCGSCHGSSANTGVSVLISGPDTVVVGQTAQYSMSISMSGKTGAGLDIARRLGTLAPVSTNIHLSGIELVHSQNIPMTGGTATVQFNYIAPLINSVDTLWATGLATNSNGGTSGDSWNWCSPKRIVVRLPLGINNISIPSDFSVAQNFPNPFNPTTNIKIDLARGMFIEVTVFDAEGKKIDKIQSGKLSPGEHSITWNASKFSSGIYYYAVSGYDPASSSEQTFTVTKKMILVK